MKAREGRYYVPAFCMPIFCGTLERGRGRRGYFTREEEAGGVNGKKEGIILPVK